MCNTEGKDLNRLKVVLAGKKSTNKWLAEQKGVDQAKEINHGGGSTNHSLSGHYYSLLCNYVQAKVITYSQSTKLYYLKMVTRTRCALAEPPDGILAFGGAASRRTFTSSHIGVVSV